MNAERIKEIYKKIYEALVVSKCPACGEIVRYSGTLCDACLEKYKEEKKAECPYCKMTADMCVCNTRGLDFCGRLGRSMYSGSFYGSKYPVLQRTIFSLKQNCDRNSEKFFAREMSEEILKLLEENGESAGNWRITYPPRSRKSVLRYGFDHAKQLAQDISCRTGIKFEAVFTHSGKTVQKELDRHDRIKNARKSFDIRKDVDAEGKSYIIVDDVITSGATMKRCQTLLLKNRADAAFPLSIAKTSGRGAGFDRETRKKRRKRSRRPAE